MAEPTVVEIPLSRKKLVKLMLFSVLFICGGCWIVLTNPQVSNSMFNDPVIKYSAGAGGIIMGLLGLYFFTKKTLQNKPGIVFTATGLLNRSGALSGSEILWDEIAGAIEIKVAKRWNVLVVLKDPESYIVRQSGTVRKKLMRETLRQYGSPVCISLQSFKISHTELLEMIRKKIEAHNNPPVT